MAESSRSIGNQLARFKLAVAGAKRHAAKLPKEAGVAATALAKHIAEVEELNQTQESLKQELAAATKALGTTLKKAQAERARVVRFAEASFGPRDARIKEFRPASEGRVSAPRKRKPNG